MDPSEAILRQLRWIKWLTALLALSLAAIAATFVWLSWEMNSSFERAGSASRFAERATALLEAGKENEALALCDEHEKKFPNDPYVDWHRGKAYYQLGRLPEALKSMRRAHDHAPHWQAEWTGPYIKAIEDKLRSR